VLKAMRLRVTDSLKSSFVYLHEALLVALP